MYVYRLKKQRSTQQPTGFFSKPKQEQICFELLRL